MSQPTATGTLNSPSATNQPDSASTNISPATSFNTASPSDQDSTLDLPKWDSHVWRAESVHQLINASPEVIQLTATQGQKRARVSVHAELLCHYSAYYRAALRGKFKEAGSKSLDANATKEELNLLVSWLYGGILHVPNTMNTRILSLYVFADRFDMPALRRHIIGDWCNLSATNKMLKYEYIKHLYATLPTSSPMIQFLVDVAAMHWSFCARSLDNAYEQAPKAYFYAVLKAREASTDSSASKNKKKECPCCHDACRYHEHESDEESKATCGT